MNDDTISRQAAIDAIVNTPSDIQNENIPLVNQYDGATFRQIEILGILESLPSAERRGRWEHYEHREPQYDIEGYKTWAEAYKCSNCGFIHTVIEDFGHYTYCPNCGARMEVE